MVHLPYGGGRQSPGQPGAVLESWVATMEEESRRMYHLPHGGSRPAGPELPWGAGGYQERREQTDVPSSPWRRKEAI